LARKLRYEAVRSDRNLYSKNLIESQDEIAEMKRKFKIMNHQIEQLKEEIQAKDQAYVKERIEHTRSDKEKEALKNELMRIKKLVSTAETTMKNYQAEVDKLNHIISEADAERFRQQREYDIVINERDILGTQLIRRNDELALLYEKVKIQRNAISQGEVAYRERLEDVRVLRLRENGLRRELHIQRSQTSALDGLRSEVYTLQRELLQDRAKVKALSEEPRIQTTRTGGAGSKDLIRALTRWCRRSRRCRSDSSPKRRRWSKRTCSSRRRISYMWSSRTSSLGSLGPRWRSSSPSTSRA